MGRLELIILRRDKVMSELFILSTLRIIFSNSGIYLLIPNKWITTCSGPIQIQLYYCLFKLILWGRSQMEIFIGFHFDFPDLGSSSQVPEPSDPLQLLNCPDCGLKFFESQYLMEHQKTKHQKGLTTSEDPIVSEPEDTFGLEAAAGLQKLAKPEPDSGSGAPDLLHLMEQVKPCSVLVQRLPLDPKTIQDLRGQCLEAAPVVSGSGHQDEVNSEFITTVFDNLDVKREDLTDDPLHIPTASSTLAKAGSCRSKSGRNSLNSGGDLAEVIGSCELKKTTVKLASLADLLGADGSVKDEPDIIVCDSDLSVISPTKTGSETGSDLVGTSPPCKRIRLDSSANRNEPVLTSLKTISLNAAQH